MTINLINYALAKKDWNKAYEDLKVLEKGGRNLILNSNYFPLDSSDHGNRGLTEIKIDENGIEYFSVTPIYNGNIYWNRGMKFSEPRYKDEVYTFSFDVMTEQDENWSFYFYTDRQRIITNIPSTKGKWVRYTYTFTQEVTKNDNIMFGFRDLKAGKEIGWRRLKLEKGNKATDWTPAPEDINAHPFVAELAETVYRSKQNEERIRNLENALTALGGGS